MEIREVKKIDITEIISMMKSLFLTWDKIDPMDKIDRKWFSSKDSDKLIAKRIKTKYKKYFIAEQDGKIIGYIFGLIEIREACLDKKIGLIDELYVKPRYRKLGVGNFLKNEMLVWFKSNKVKWSIVLTHSKDSTANPYWKHSGYRLYNNKFKIRI